MRLGQWADGRVNSLDTIDSSSNDSVGQGLNSGGTLVISTRGDGHLSGVLISDSLGLVGHSSVGGSKDGGDQGERGSSELHCDVINMWERYETSVRGETVDEKRKEKR